MKKKTVNSTASCPQLDHPMCSQSCSIATAETGHVAAATAADGDTFAIENANETTDTAAAVSDEFRWQALPLETTKIRQKVPAVSNDNYDTWCSYSWPIQRSDSTTSHSTSKIRTNSTE